VNQTCFRRACRPRPRAQGKPNTGNRFDSPTGAYGVRYFASDLDGCYGETLARFRADKKLAK
jgi:hypothetical protein